MSIGCPSPAREGGYEGDDRGIQTMGFDTLAQLGHDEEERKFSLYRSACPSPAVSKSEEYCITSMT